MLYEVRLWSDKFKPNQWSFGKFKNIDEAIKKMEEESKSFRVYLAEKGEMHLTIEAILEPYEIKQALENPKKVIR